MAKHGYLHLARTLHVYLTMFSSVALSLFAFTGFVMNHEAWFGLGKGRDAPALQKQAAAGSVETRVEGAGAPAPREGAMAAKRDVDDRASARAPANRGLLSKLITLHKGKPASLPLTLLIDTSAIVLMLGSITGVIMLVAITPRRRLGLTLMGAGTLGAVLVFLFFVP